MSDEIKHECAVAMVVLRKPPSGTDDFGGTKLSLLMEKQHNRGQDGAGAAILAADPEPGEEPYWIAKSASATPLVDVLGAIARRPTISHGDTAAPSIPRLRERVFLGHLRYATFGKNDTAFCHPFVHEASELEHTMLLAGNFNLTNAAELFEDYGRHGSFATSKADGYLICELIAHEIGKIDDRAERVGHVENATQDLRGYARSARQINSATSISRALSNALANADGAWTLCGMTGDGWAFATRDPHGIRPGFYYIDDEVVVVASERPAIQAAFDVPPEAVKELPCGQALIVSPDGEIQMSEVQMSERSDIKISPRPCSFERIYFSRANDADIHSERKALGAALLPQILEAANAPIEDIFFSYIPNSARIAFHGLLEKLFEFSAKSGEVGENSSSWRKDVKFQSPTPTQNSNSLSNSNLQLQLKIPRFGEIAVKDAKFRTFIADAAARREFYKHVYDVTYGLVRPGRDTLVVLDDSIVRGNTMKNAILPMLDRLGPKRIVIASSAPPIRYPDCYGIDMSTLNELVAFKALVNLLGDKAESELTMALDEMRSGASLAGHGRNPDPNPLASLYLRFSEEEHAAEIARLLTPSGMKAEVVVVYQTIEGLRKCLWKSAPTNDQRPTTSCQMPTTNYQLSIGDWYFTGDYPTPGGYKVLRKALANYLARKTDRSY